MEFRYRHTPTGKPRGVRIDGETGDAIYLIKKVSTLRATYQVRAAAWRAASEAKQLVIRTPRGFVAHATLARLIAETGELIRIERF